MPCTDADTAHTACIKIIKLGLFPTSSSLDGRGRVPVKARASSACKVMSSGAMAHMMATCASTVHFLSNVEHSAQATAIWDLLMLCLNAQLQKHGCWHNQGMLQVAVQMPRYMNDTLSWNAQRPGFCHAEWTQQA